MGALTPQEQCWLALPFLFGPLVRHDRAGVHWTFLGQVERGQHSIRLDNIVKIAAGLGVSAGRLIENLPTG